MSTTNFCLKSYLKCIDDKNLTKTRKRVNAKKHTKRHYGGAVDSVGSADAGGMGESLLSEVAKKVNKIDLARQLFHSAINQPGSTRGAIIQNFVDRVGVTDSTAVSYYERLAKEAGLTNQSNERDTGSGMSDDEADNATMRSHPDYTHSQNDSDQNEETPGEEPPASEDGMTIRTIPGAHLIHKKETADGTFEELWIYNTNHGVLDDELKIRRSILAGTDIEAQNTISPDGKQELHLTTMGNAQYIKITGLPN